MNRWLIFLGILAGGFILFQIYTGRIDVNDAFKMSNTNVLTDDSVEHFLTWPDGDSSIKDDDFSVLAFGDIMLGRYVRILMEKYGKDYVFKNIADEGGFKKGADIVFGNLEGPILGQGRKGGTSMVFSFNEDVAPFLKKYGFDLLSISNNHAIDQGWEGRGSTMTALSYAGIAWCGHPTELGEDNVYYGEDGDKKYAFICVNDIKNKLDDEAAVALIQQIRPKVDYLIVSAHWGTEYSFKPSFNLQISPAHSFVDAGADFVIGHHPHVVQSFEIYNGRFIFYSLGNFIFDQYWAKSVQEELGIGIVFNKENVETQIRTKVYLFPMKSILSQPNLLTGENYSSWAENFIKRGNFSEELKKEIRQSVVYSK